jgi:hypothetical protein
MSAFQQGAANAPWAAVVLVAVVAVLGYVGYRRLHIAELRFDRGLAYNVPVIATVIALAYGTALGIQERATGELRDYCAYGAVSRAQLTGCLDHVTDQQIERLQTDAAQFATGQIDTCLTDAGPYCADRAAARQASQDEPSP